MNKVADHPIEDFYGDEILSGETYFIFGEHVVLEENLKLYLIQHQNVECFRAV
ncbi:hypothetical protein P4I81_07995 [Bacillus cereus]|nr:MULTISPECIES: hypothetical protein [Bacillus cereus group]ANT40100.1 hypothetical protein BMBtpLA4_6 [Bacillus phage vB_BtS_BMBtp15]MEB8632407.1 hypothetical protein [Bacillus cereus]MEB8741415.1 hypothetical protein [Bacillus cereus]MEB8772342.1 hypothetical protein [Bacillus cereus]MEB8790333.1 hypothetical protein [Bacillus cereus]